MNSKLVNTLGITILAALLLTGCSVAAEATPDPAASAASAPAPEAETPPAAEVENPLIKPFGEVVTYEDGVSISVSPGAQFTPGEYSAGAETGVPLVFKIVITNNATEPVSPMVFPTATSGGQGANSIADVGNLEYGDLGLPPTTTLLPGQTIEFFYGFAVADPADVTFEVSPTGFEHEAAIFTTAG